LTLELAVVAKRSPVDLLDDELADGSLGIQKNRDGSQVDEFQRYCAGKARVYGRRREVNE